MREIVFFCSLIAVSFLALVSAELKLTQVQVLFRHGDRTPAPEDLYPKDIHDLSVYEPWGIGQLINTGKMREYKIGQLLKTRYQELLGSLYLPGAIYAVSTEFDRTKMSLQLVLAGLFPPAQAETWHSELPWMPIPTHYTPEPLDIVLRPHLCPRFVDEVARVTQLPEVQEKIAQYSDLFHLLTAETGLNVNEPEIVYRVFNTLVSQNAMNLTWPTWCTDDVFRQMEEVTILQYNIWAYTTELRRINGGSTVRRFIENMHLNRTEDNPRKMYLYSAHENTIAAYLQAQGIDEPKIPHYGTTVMFEKLKDDNGKLYVKLVLWTGVTEQLITLRVPGCEEICPIETYLQLTKEIIPSDEEQNCHWNRLSVQELRKVFDEHMSK